MIQVEQISQIQWLWFNSIKSHFLCEDADWQEHHPVLDPRQWGKSTRPADAHIRQQVAEERQDPLEGVSCLHIDTSGICLAHTPGGPLLPIIATLEGVDCLHIETSGDFSEHTSAKVTFVSPNS